GISAESGIPTFRGPGGLWRTFHAEELATQEAFDRDPKLVWEWYQSRREIIASKEPNAAHRALVKLEKTAGRFTLITQNVDGLHDRAGSKRVLKIHGDIWFTRCTKCIHQRVNRSLDMELPPRCEECSAWMRPGVVWFGESLPRLAWEDAEREVNGCDLLLVIGTSAQVYPAAGLIDRARAAGVPSVEINLDETPYSAAVKYSLRGKAAEILPLLLE
ncbi:MAG: NAD-dependent deacylase, partial [Acidobacteria bacterium]|nr:NAD-dependent deacylase [Acidobacteriota bacterium]